MESNKNQEKEFLRNIGFTDKTNEILHLKSKVINQRFRDGYISKDLDKKAWADLS